MKKRISAAVLSLIIMAALLFSGSALAVNDYVNDSLPVNAEFYVYNDYGRPVPFSEMQDPNVWFPGITSVSVDFGSSSNSATVGTLRQTGAVVRVPSGYYVERVSLVSNGTPYYDNNDKSIVKFATADKYSPDLSFDREVFSDSFAAQHSDTPIFADHAGSGTTCYSFQVVLKKLSNTAVLRYRDGLFELGDLGVVSSGSDYNEFTPGSGYSHRVNELAAGNYETAIEKFSRSFTGWELVYENESTATVYAGEEIRPYGNCTIFARWQVCDTPVVTPVPVVPDPVKYDVYISAVGIDTVFTGSPIVPTDFSVSGAPAGATVDAVLGGTLYGPGSSEITLQSVRIYKDGSDITDSCNIYYTPAYIYASEQQAAKTAITVCPESIVRTYTGNPVAPENYIITSGSLNYGDTLSVSYYGSITNAGTVESGISDIRVYNNGSDVTSDYEITRGTGTVTVEKYAVTLRANPVNAVYDGSTVGPNGYTISAVPDGTVVDAVLGGAVNGPGSTQITLDSVKVYYQGTDVTDNFNISYEPALITVTKNETAKIQLSIRPEDVTRQYDGTPLAPKNYIITSGALREGDRLVVEYNGYLTNPGFGESSIASARVIRGELDVTDEYYELSFSTGSIVVEKRALTITANSVDAVYTGTAVGPNGFTNSEVPEGTTVDAKLTGSVTEPGSCQIGCESVTITCGAENVTDFYTVQFVPATITVRAPDKISITVTPENIGKEYDGTPIVPEAYRVSGALRDGDRLVVGFTGTLTDAGTAESGIASVQVMNGDKDVTSLFYNITTGKAQITISKRSITLTADSASKHEDGTALSLDRFSLTAGSLVQGDSVSAHTTGSVSGVGSVSNVIQKNTVRITSAYGKDVTANYNVVLIPGMLTILKSDTPLPTPTPYVAPTASPTRITVKAPVITKQYDGTPADISSMAPTITFGVLPQGCRVQAVYDTASMTNAGSTAVHITSVKIVDANGYDITQRFDITTENGSIDIAKRSLVITTPSASKVYDGNALTNYSATASGKLDGHNIALKFTGAQRNVGSSLNTVDEKNVKVYYTYNGSEVVVTSNYNISFQYGTLTVTAASGGSTNTNTNTNPNSPATGDSSNIWLWIALMAGALVIGVVVAIVVIKSSRSSKKSSTSGGRHSRP